MAKKAVTFVRARCNGCDAEAHVHAGALGKPHRRCLSGKSGKWRERQPT